MSAKTFDLELLKDELRMRKDFWRECADTMAAKAERLALANDFKGARQCRTSYREADHKREELAHVLDMIDDIEGGDPFNLGE